MVQAAGVGVANIGPILVDMGHTDVPSAGTRVALSTDGGLHADMRVVWAHFKGDNDNTGDVFVGIADVSATHGWTLENNDDVGLVLPIPAGSSIALGTIYFDAATNGDDVEWALLIQV
jgi:hypothetical protein